MRARNALLGVGALAAVAVAIALFALEMPRDRAASAEHASAADRSEATLEPRAPGGVELRDARAQAVEPVAEPATPPTSAPEASAASGALVDVLVLRRADQTPIADAELACFEPERVDQPFDVARWLREPDADGRFERAARYRTDESGHAHVAEPRAQAVVVGRARDAWGLKLISHDQPQPIELVLEIDGDLLAHVVDALGKPVANVPIALRRGQFGAFNDYVLALTDGDGLARLRHARAVVPGRPRGWRVAIRGVFDPPLEAELGESLPSDPVQLVIPPFGACDVSVLDEYGKPCHEPLSILLRIAKPDADEPHLGSYLRGSALATDRTEDAGASFEPVQLGAPLEVFVQRARSDVEHRASALGPTHAGERARAVVRLSETGCALTGRVLDEDGLVLTQAATRARLLRSDHEGAPDGDRALALDADGRFLYELEVDGQAATPTFTVYLVGEQGVELSSASVALPALLATGLLDLGDLRLARSPTLVAGTVFDHFGNSLSGAEVHVATPRQFSLDEIEWLDVEALKAISDADGNFALRARLDVAQIQVTAQKDDRASEPVFVAPGASGVALRMIPSGGLVGRLMFDAALVKRWGFRIVASQLDAVSGEQRQVSCAQLQPDGAFAMRQLRAGTYDVNVSTFDFEGDLQVAQVRDVRVEVDRVTRDPRLDPLDLRGKVRVLTLTVVDGGGARVPGAWYALRWLDAGFEASGRALEIRDSSTSVLCGSHGFDVRAGAPEMLDAELRGVTRDETIVLRGAQTVELVLADSVKLPEPPLFLGALIITEHESAGGARRGMPATFDERRRALVPAAVLGRAQVQFFVMYVSKSRNAWHALELATPTSIEVSSGAPDQVFAVSFDYPDLESACRKLVGKE